MTTKRTHTIIKADPKGRWTYCTECGRDVSADGSRHYVTKATTVAARLTGITRWVPTTL